MAVETKVFPALTQKCAAKCRNGVVIGKLRVVIRG